jgi:hypothetical protein
MTETNIDYSAIEHLDFEPSEDKSIRCEGFVRRISGEVVEDTRGCSAPAVLITFRGCCGMMKYYCKSCYNKACASNAFSHFVSEGVAHENSTPKFSRVELL